MPYGLSNLITGQPPEQEPEERSMLQDILTRSGVQTQRAIEAWSAPEMWSSETPLMPALKATGRAFFEAGKVPYVTLDPLARPVFEALGLVPEQAPTTVELPPIPEKSEPTWRILSQQLYGMDGELEQETVSSMLADPQGRDRFRMWRSLVQKDQHYAPRLQAIRKEIDDPEAFWTKAIDEYKASRLKDARIGLPSPLGRTVLEAAAFAAPEMRALTAMKAAGVPKALMARSFAYSGLGGEALEGLGKITVGAGISGARYAAHAPVGVAARMGSKAAKEYLAEKAAIESGKGVAKILQQGVAHAGVEGRGAEAFAAHGLTGPRASYENIGAAFGTEVPYGGAIPRALLGGAVGGLIGGDPEDAIIGAMAAGLGPHFLKPLGRMTFPGFARFGIPSADVLARRASGLDPGISGPPTLEATLGASVAREAVPSHAPTLLAPTVGGVAGMVLGSGDPDAEPLVDFALGAGAGLAASAGMGAWRNAAAKRAVDNLDVTGFRVWVEGLRPPWVEGLLPQVETAERPLLQRAVGLLNDAGERSRAEMEVYAKSIEEAMGSKGTDRAWREGPLYEALRRTGRGGKALEVGELWKLDDETLEAAYKMRRTMDEEFNKQLASGRMSEAQYIEGYVGQMLDEPKFYEAFQPRRSLMNPKYSEGLTRRLVGAFKKIGVEEAPDGTAVTAFDLFTDPRLGGWEQFFQKWQSGHMKLKDVLSPKDYSDFRYVVDRAREFQVTPPTILKILSGSHARTQAARMTSKKGELFGFEPEVWPEELLNQFAKLRTGSSLPFIRDPYRATMTYLDRSTRARNMGPLVEMHKAPVTPGSVETMWVKPLIGEELDKLKAAGFDNEAEILKNITLHRLGFPNKSDMWIENAAQRVYPHRPGMAKAVGQLLSDFQYAGALWKPASGTRNLWQVMLAATALGPRAVGNGMMAYARNPDGWKRLAEEAGATRNVRSELTQEAELVDTYARFGKIGALTKQFLDTSLTLYQHSDDFTRTRAFASAYLELMQNRAKQDVSMLRPTRALRVQNAITDAERTGKWHEAASVFGKELSDSTNWIYGREGSPLMMQSFLGKQMMMFSTWPLNYVMWVKHMAGNGKLMDVVNMGLAATLLDRFMKEQAGITRFTGLSAYGGQEDPRVPWPFATGPMPTRFGGPGANLVADIGQMGAETLFQGDPPTLERLGKTARFELATSLGPVGSGAERAYRVSQEDDPWRQFVIGYGYTPERR